MRQFTPYEFNLLTRQGYDPFKVANEIPIDMPVEYFTGKAEFRDLVFKVNNNTLIPRAETEELVNIALGRLKDRSFGDKITFADVGTGSGAIGISFATELIKKGLAFDGYLSDISEEALEVARFNLEEILCDQKANCFKYNHEFDSIKIIKSDLLQDYPKNKKFDIVFANLPYIPSKRIIKLDTSVKDYEPKLALDGGKDGLDLISKLLTQAKMVLSFSGIVLLEVDDTHVNASEFKNEWNILIQKDLNNKVRFWLCTLKA